MGLFLLMLVVIGSALLICVGIEPERSASVRTNLFASLLQLSFTQLTNPAVSSLFVWIGGSVGRPPIHLAGGRWLPVSVFVMLASADLIEYGFHRLQHRIPFLWAMHSFHHSDASMNATTAYRAYWLERPLALLAFAPLGLIFSGDKSVLLIAAILNWIIPVFHHMNVRLRFLPWLIVTPAFHRMHHSTKREHFDRNFSGFLPLWDLIFGTYIEPEGFPETGLDEEEPRGVKDTIWWAFR